jgi:hypothetical protein
MAMAAWQRSSIYAVMVWVVSSRNSKVRRLPSKTVSRTDVAVCRYVFDLETPNYLEGSVQRLGESAERNFTPRQFNSSCCSPGRIGCLPNNTKPFVSVPIRSLVRRVVLLPKHRGRLFQGLALGHKLISNNGFKFGSNGIQFGLSVGSNSLVTKDANAVFQRGYKILKVACLTDRDTAFPVCGIGVPLATWCASRYWRNVLKRGHEGQSALDGAVPASISPASISRARPRKAANLERNQPPPG